MTPLERAIAAVNNTARVQNIAGDQQGVIGDAPLHIVVNPGDIARAVLQVIREPSEAMVDEAYASYTADGGSLRDVFMNMIDAALEEG